jgi:hypothetical protein
MAVALGGEPVVSTRSCRAEEASAPGASKVKRNSVVPDEPVP